MVLYNHRGRGRRGEAFGNMRTFIYYYMNKGKAEANVSGTKGKLSEKQKQVARGEEAHNAEEFAGHVLLADIEQNILYGASYLHLLEKVYFRNINDKEARTLCILAAYNMGPGRFTRLFAENPDEAIRIINLYSNIGLYEEIKLRYGNKNYTYIDKVITLMLQYQKRGY